MGTYRKANSHSLRAGDFVKMSSQDTDVLRVNYVEGVTLTATNRRGIEVRVGPLPEGVWRLVDRRPGGDLYA